MGADLTTNNLSSQNFIKSFSKNYFFYKEIEDKNFGYF